MARDRLRFSRWTFVAVVVVAVGTAGTYQYAWPVIRGPLSARSGASETATGTIFSVLIVAQTLAAFPGGWVRDRRGPRIPLLVGSALLLAGFVGAALAPSLPALYLWFALGGAGVGIAYDIAVNTPSRWFDRRRGMATGAVSMAFSGVSFVLIPFVRRGAESAYVPTLLVLAAAAGGSSLVAAVVLRDPETDAPNRPRASRTDGAVDSAITWRTMIRTRRFWFLYAVFVVANGVGLMLIEKVVSYANQLGLSPTAVTAAASLVALGQALGVLALGTVSDRLGRERTLVVSLVLCGISLAATVVAGRLAFEWAFVAFAGITMFFRSPSFSIMPALVGEYYGETYSSENYAVLLTAKLWGGIFGGTVTSVLVLDVGWSTTFLVAAGLALGAGVAALWALRTR
ncbi:OFA family MFS transporter [Haladaptatus salinisoli]|uniref:OFA family MFS transporter n=1 Tax=Haladaptatus salinisoli TaxID=2884876 RepID=UPI001D0B2272|nr:OFA family MFS transporter [Haladaptatus salinisoli]